MASDHGDERLQDEPLPVGPRARPSRQSDITLHQLRIFWTVGHSETITKAAKHLGLTQPSLSQQLAKLESLIGTRLFERRASQMELTEAGAHLMRHAEQVLRAMRQLEDDLSGFGSGTRQTLHVAGINSAMRVLAPHALRALHRDLPDIDFDLHESAPADVLEMLYARRANVGLIASNSIAEASVSFTRIPLINDPYVLVVPEWLRLEGVTDPERDLDPHGRKVINQVIQFVFGTQHAKRIDQLYDTLLPGHSNVAKCRSFEGAIAMVGAGLGICLAPSLSCVVGGSLVPGVRLYRVEAEQDRQIVALVPSQYRHNRPYAALLGALEQAAMEVPIPAIGEAPPFVRSAG